MKGHVLAFAVSSSSWLVFLAAVSAGAALDLPGTWPSGVLVPLFPGLFGFVAMMLFGYGYHLLPLLHGRPLRHPSLAWVHLVLGNSAVLLFVATLYADSPTFLLVGALLWLVGVTLWVANLVITAHLSGGLRLHPPTFRTGVKSDHLVERFLIGVPPYLVASAVMLFLWAAGDLIHFSVPLAAAVHLFTLGVVTLMIYGAGTYLLPRLFDSAPSTLLIKLGSPLALSAPIVVALGTWLYPWMLPVGGLLASGAAVAFAANVARSYALSPRRTRPGWAYLLFPVLSVSFLLAGVGLGTAFGLWPQSRVYVESHAWINVLGFAGLMVAGISHGTLRHFRPLFHVDAEDSGVALKVEWGFITLVAWPSGLALIALSATEPRLQMTGHLVFLAGATVFAAQILHAVWKARWAHPLRWTHAPPHSSEVTE